MDARVTPAWEQLVAAHYAQFWGPAGRPMPFAGARALDLPADFAVLGYPPSNLRPFWTYATCGMSQPTDLKAVELFMTAPYSAPEVVELLHATAHFHRAGAALAPGSTVNFGRPWMGASACSFGLVTLPYLDGPRLETATVGGRQAKVYWLLPITPQETAFMKAKGLAELEEAFRREPISFLDPRRPSAV